MRGARVRGGVRGGGKGWGQGEEAPSLLALTHTVDETLKGMSCEEM